MRTHRPFSDSRRGVPGFLKADAGRRSIFARICTYQSWLAAVGAASLLSSLSSSGSKTPALPGRQLPLADAMQTLTSCNRALIPSRQFNQAELQHNRPTTPAGACTTLHLTWPCARHAPCPALRQPGSAQSKPQSGSRRAVRGGLTQSPPARAIGTGAPRQYSLSSWCVVITTSLGHSIGSARG